MKKYTEKYSMILEERKYYSYHLVNNPDIFPFFDDDCSNRFKLLDDEERQVEYILYAYCKNNELYDVVTNQKIVYLRNLNENYLDYNEPRKWLAFSNCIKVETIEVANQLKELIDTNLVGAYAEKMNYVENVPMIKYEEKVAEKKANEEAELFLENYRKNYR